MFISSSSNPKIQRARALLNQRQARHEQHAFVVEGVRLVEEALDSGWEAQMALYSDQLSERGMETVERFRALKVDVSEVPPRLMDQITGTETPQGLLAVFRQRDIPLPDAPDFVLIADNLRDPGNLGALLRSAAAFGVQAVILSPGNTDAFAPKVLRAGMGAHFRLPIYHRSWEEIRALCKEHAPTPLTIYLADANEGVACWDLDLRQPVALIVGSEAEGASPRARELRDQTISIPMPGQSESLNAAVAASILLFEVVRQRR